MNTRRTALTLGAAAGGLLTAGFLSTAVASAQGEVDPTPGADAFTIGAYTFDPYTMLGDTPGSEGFDPLTFGTGSPTYFDTGAIGDQGFNVFTTNTDGTTSMVGAVTSTENVTQLFGITNTGFDVTGYAAGADDSLLPAVGTVYDVTNYGYGYENFYTDVPSATMGDPGTVTDTLVTPFGSMDLSQYFTPFDLTALDPGAAFGVGADTATGMAGAAADSGTGFLAELASLFSL